MYVSGRLSWALGMSCVCEGRGLTLHTDVVHLQVEHVLGVASRVRRHAVRLDHLHAAVAALTLGPVVRVRGLVRAVSVQQPAVCQHRVAVRAVEGALDLDDVAVAAVEGEEGEAPGLVTLAHLLGDPWGHTRLCQQSLYTHHSCNIHCMNFTWLFADFGSHTCPCSHIPTSRHQAWE